MVLRRLSILLIMFCLCLVSALSTSSDDWKYALGWNGQTATNQVIGHTLTVWGAQTSTQGGVYICSKPNFQGLCIYTVFPQGCIMLNAAWARRIQSIAPDKGTAITLYKTYTCSDSHTAKVYHEPTGTNFIDCAGSLALSMSITYLSPTESQPTSVLPTGCALAGHWVQPRTPDNETLG